ncbi:MAG: PDZ domain-containing protein [Gammaproteobacteria bacterium]|nr:PDZ domain-containing protein [Gammaproteobacteria bacterium]MDE0368321.1 PDZ domain-containing protein [Gammaproteobacteria bacterium]
METLLKKIAARAATPAKWLIVLGMAYTLATTVLFVTAPQEAASVPPESTAAAVSRDAGPGADLDSIIAANLFGVAGAAPSEAAAAAAARESLAETRLPLVLHGVFVAETPEESTAILARKGRSEELYHIGDRVPGNATLDTVYLDHVLLRRGRSLERLTFPKTAEGLAIPSPRAETAPSGSLNSRALRRETGSSPDSAPSARPTTGNAAEASPGEMAERVRERLKADPENALGELGLTPVGGDGAAGYRLDRLSRSPYLRQTGLKPGDVILSINGQPVGDVGRDRLELDNVLAQGSARIEVQRGERRFFITASLQ